MTGKPIQAADTKVLSPNAAMRRQRAYATKRRLWAEAVGRPYLHEDQRPPPGELDAGPDE